MIELREIYKIYKNGNIGIENINLIFPAVGFIGILGESGSGKSTLLNCLGGLDNFSSGEILYNGKPIKNLKAYSTYVFQEYKLIESMTVYDNLIFANSKISEEKLDYYLTRLGIKEFKNQKVNALSGGQRQRVEIIRALVQEAEVLFFDEPTANVDLEQAEDIFRFIQEESEYKLCIVVSHNEVLLKEFTKQIVEIENHQIKSNSIEIKEKDEKEYKEVKEKDCSFFVLLKLVIQNIKYNKVKTGMNVIFLLMAILLLSILVSMKTTDPVELIYETTKENNYGVCVAKPLLYTNSDDRITISNQNISNKEFLDDYNYLLRESYKYILDVPFIPKESNDRIYYSSTNDHILEVKDGKFHNFQLADDEVLLSKVEIMSHNMKKTKYDAEDLIGQKLKFGPNSFIIKGFVESIGDAYAKYARMNCVPLLVVNSSTFEKLCYNYSRDQIDFVNRMNNCHSSFFVYNHFWESNPMDDFLVSGRLPKKDNEICIDQIILPRCFNLELDNAIGKEIAITFVNKVKGGNDKSTLNFKVVGIGTTAILTNSMFDNITMNYQYTSKDGANILLEEYTLKDFKRLYSKGVGILLKNDDSDALVKYYYEKRIEDMRVLQIFAIVIFVFTLVVLLASIESSMIRNKKMMGLFVSFKIKRRSMVSVFYLESLVSIIVSALLIFLFFFPILLLFNNNYKSLFRLDIIYIYPNYLWLFIIVLTFIGIITLYMVYPVIKMIKSKPIDLLFLRK